jgi:hypothetical protein
MPSYRFQNLIDDQNIRVVSRFLSFRPFESLFDRVDERFGVQFFLRKDADKAAGAVAFGVVELIAPALSFGKRDGDRALAEGGDFGEAIRPAPYHGDRGEREKIAYVVGEFELQIAL